MERQYFSGAALDAAAGLKARTRVAWTETGFIRRAPDGYTLHNVMRAAARAALARFGVVPVRWRWGAGRDQHPVIRALARDALKLLIWVLTLTQDERADDALLTQGRYLLVAPPAAGPARAGTAARGVLAGEVVTFKTGFGPLQITTGLTSHEALLRLARGPEAALVVNVAALLADVTRKLEGCGEPVDFEATVVSPAAATRRVAAQSREVKGEDHQ